MIRWGRERRVAEVA